jgi:hypothetical protein
MVGEKKEPCDSLSRKTTIHGPRRTIQAGKRQVMPKADKSILKVPFCPISTYLTANSLVSQKHSKLWGRNRLFKLTATQYLLRV